MRTWQFLVWLSALLVVSVAANTCFQFPKGRDYAPLLSPSVKWAKDKKNDAEAKCDLSPLFDKAADVVNGTRVEFFDPDKGALQIDFDLPTSLPLLDFIRVIGRGALVVTVKDKFVPQTENYNVQLGHDEVQMELDVYRGSKMEAGSVTIRGLTHQAYLTSLEFIASSKNPVDDSYDETEDEAGEAGEEEHQWTQHEIPEIGPEIEGCMCVGWPKNGGNGGTCGIWDADCPGIGWCYVKPNACNDSKVSRQWPTLHWSCQPCIGANITVTTPPAKAPGVKRVKPEVSKPCASCTMPLILGIFGGLAVGTVLVILVIQRQRPVGRLMRRVDDAEDDDELGHHD